MDTSNRIYPLLENLYASRSKLHLANDPLSFCHRYDAPRDQEVAAVIASTFAYGGIKIILRTLETIFAELGPSPRQFIEKFDPESGLKTFSRFKHRFNDGRDLCALLWGIRMMLEQSGSVESFFLAGHDNTTEDITAALNCYTSTVLSLDYSPVFGQPNAPANSYFPFMFPAPASGSACKRLCMFLRWVARPADGIDLGIWHGIAPSRLIIPVDTHIQRICGYLGFTCRKNADWRMAQEITGHLRRLDPLDPIRYDFSLAHLGISERCSGNDPAACLTCSIAGICTPPGTDARKRR
ncbi:TIGR02757 family protein [Pelotalea chapellei]|uniref:TIGR02757 family protein n=1 Tax=Pelotalea chapellei TaxID=44671 RepID=A0ABS5UC04_9BACT|nr:TIGR02757 family protein [Pelotalea chapellei]MBT1073226.1 TIGR02757 family protein [Pelotalea chapellei]